MIQKYTKVIPGEDYIHDHHLVVMDMHLKVRKYRKTTRGCIRCNPGLRYGN